MSSFSPPVGVVVASQMQDFVTLPGFANEQEAHEAFERIATATDLFNIEHEVSGCYTQPRLDVRGERPRIDFVLIPKKKLIDAGWTYGSIGVEAKRSDEKIGPVVAQCLDYGRSTFKLSNGSHVMLDQIFIWPFEKAYGGVESIMTQHRIGGVYEDRGTLVFKMSATNAIRCKPGENPKVGTLAFGRRSGSR